MASLAGHIAHESSTARRILVVDDDVDSADVVAQALEIHGHETRVAYEPLSALTVAAEFRPQVAILDVNLPTMDGHELGEALRKDLPGCKFIALTADATTLNYLRSQWVGFHDHLTKPVALDELLIAISETRPSGTFPRNPRIDALFRDPATQPQRERAWIYLHESCEVVRYWTTALGCTEAQLRAAVDEVGVNSDHVRRHLRK
jgi:CheY-like chemotaxis protein